MKAAKKADQEFGLPKKSERHTTCEAAADIFLHLLENYVTQRYTGFHFWDIAVDGFSNMTPAWLKRVLTPAPDAEDTSINERQSLEESTADYELYHVS